MESTPQLYCDNRESYLGVIKIWRRFRRDGLQAKGPGLLSQQRSGNFVLFFLIIISILFYFIHLLFAYLFSFSILFLISSFYFF